MTNDTKKIIYPHLILCEGIDAEKYIVYFLEALYRNRPETDRRFQAMDFGGKEDLGRLMNMLPRLSGFDALKSLIVLQDSETNPKGESDAIKAAFRKNRFAVPNGPCRFSDGSEQYPDIKTAYALFPAFDSDATPGTLEDLCLETLAVEKPCAADDRPCADCNALLQAKRNVIHKIADETVLRVEACLDTLARENAHEATEHAVGRFGKFRRKHKNRLYTYLSLTNAFVSQKLGEAAKAGAYDFDSVRLRPFETLLLNALKA